MMFRGPLRLCLGRYLAFHRFDQVAHVLIATSLCPAHRNIVLIARRFFAVLIDLLHVSMQRIACPAHRDKVLIARRFFAVLIDALIASMHRRLKRAPQPASNTLG